MSIAVFFGGKSCEHNISVVTGVQFLNAIKDLKPIPVYIQPDGVWVTGEELFDLSFYKNKNKRKLKRVYFTPGSNTLQSAIFKIGKIDAAILCCHGLNGEDGSLQGLLELCNVPYTGSGVAASAVCLDKILLKKVLTASGIEQLPYTYFSRREFNTQTCQVAERLNEIGWPLIIKPARLGSSIGVKIVRDEEQLVDAVRVAFCYDNMVLAEKALENFTELNCAALGRGDDVVASDVEKPIGWKEILTFQDKYGKAKSAMGREFPAKISAQLEAEIKETTIKAFKLTGCSGVARVDYMLDEDGKLWLNEINTIPGSLSAYLFKPQYTDSDLAQKLVAIAKSNRRDSEKLTYSYKTDLFSAK